MEYFCYINGYQTHHVLSWPEKWKLWTLWLVLTLILTAHVCRDKEKGKDVCVENPDSSDCQICNSSTPEQRQQLVTPSYKIKKEKREAKKLEVTPSKDSETLVDPATVSFKGAVDDKGTVSFPPPNRLEALLMARTFEPTFSTEGGGE